MQADTRPPKKGKSMIGEYILSALVVVFPNTDFLSPQLSLIQHVLRCRRLGAGDTRGHRRKEGGAEARKCKK